MDPRAALLIQRLRVPTPEPKTLPTPKTPKAKAPKKERISQADLSYLKSRAVLHVRELVDEFFRNGRLTPGGYWVTPELRVSLSTGGLWKNKAQGYYSCRPAGDVLTSYLIGAGFLVPEERIAVDDTNRVEVLKARLANRGPYRFANEGAFQRGVESLSTWLEQFPARAEVHELLGYDS
jgi:hypothetical protein